MVDAGTTQGNEGGNAEVHHVWARAREKLALESIRAFFYARGRADIPIGALYAEATLAIGGVLTGAQKSTGTITGGLFLYV